MGYVKIASLPVLKETEKAVAVPKCYLFRKGLLKDNLQSIKEGEEVNLEGKGGACIICPPGWGKNYVLVAKNDYNGRTQLNWLPKSQVKIDALTNHVVAAKPWLVADRYILMDYGEFKDAIIKATKLLCQEGIRTPFFWWGQIAPTLAKVTGVKHSGLIRTMLEAFTQLNNIDGDNVEEFIRKVCEE
ncbi:MAG: hypothetical protein H0Z19_10340 [Archaeoglobus sp.]|uniref:hypothetical protein n=1 Tax=Archaeoglobus sp. TaxID=1872626 RepID=UPI001E13F535|nr:hypothetical protein [Archaeoglobus sp.]MBO8180852.1 hypothetical protein [Archaeoglobus sp.]